MAYGTIKADSIVYDSSGSDVSVTVSTIPPTSSPTFTGNVTINAQGDIRLADSDSSAYVGFQAPATVSSSVVWTLPAADGSSGQQLSTNGSGVLSWTAPTNTAAADLTGNTLASGVTASSLTSVGTLGATTFDGDVTFTGASSNGLWDKSANAFVANVTGALTGNADTATTSTNVTISQNNSTDETVYPTFVDGNSGAQGCEVDTGLTYNPSSGVLTATSFAGTATHASVADTVDITNTQTDAAHYLAFTNGDGAGKTVGIDGNLEYNPSSNLLTAKHLYLSGNYTNSREAITQSATPTVDCSTGNYFTLTQNQNISSWTVSNVPAAGRAYAVTIELQNSSYSTAWSGWTNLKWPGNTAPTLAASKAHLLIFVTDDGGSNWRGAAIADYTV